MYKVDRSGRIFDQNMVEVVQDERDPSYQAYHRFLISGGSVEEIEGSPAPDLLSDLESAESWGRALVRQVELNLMFAGINDDRKLALNIDRELAEIGAKLKDGRLHIALAALEELLEKPEQERYSPDTMLKPIESLIRERIRLEEGQRGR